MVYRTCLACLHVAKTLRLVVSGKALKGGVECVESEFQQVQYIDLVIVDCVCVCVCVCVFVCVIYH